MFTSITHRLIQVSKGVEATLVQLLETGLLHADPHPGNLRYTSSGEIGFVSSFSDLNKLQLSFVNKI
jgi:aarF domain-containing kinase